MKLLLALILIVSYIIISGISSRIIGGLGTKKGTSQYRIEYISRTINLGLAIIFIMLASLILGIEYHQITVLLSSVFAVIGVALFAQWSILSNVTASLIIFFGFPYRVGDKIKILDNDASVTGIIDEISMFHVILNCEDGLVTYPNSLILQKAVIKLPAESAEPAA